MARRLHIRARVKPTFLSPRMLARVRPPFGVALVALVVLITGATAMTIGALAWREQRARSRAIVDTAMAQTARLAGAHTQQFLREAESIARLGPQLVAQGQLNPDDDADVERFVLAALQSNPRLTWVSFSDRADRFIGAWRDEDMEVYINQSHANGERIRLREHRVVPGLPRLLVRSSEDHRYRPSQRPFFRAAEARGGLAWTEPYEFYASNGLGITCAMPVLDADGRVQQVFTVDFSLDRITSWLDALQPSPRSRVFLATRDGTLLVGRGQPGAARTRSPEDTAFVQAIAPRIALDRESASEFEHEGERYLARAVPIAVGEKEWVVQVVAPERDWTEHADAQARQILMLALVAIAVALAGGIAVARWIARPLRLLAAQARRIRHGDLEVTLVPQSRDEIGVLTRAMNDMARALRDRNFVREALGRYVSPDLAERCLRDRDALRLGGELRQVAILMSDLRGFSTLSERLGAEAMIDLINRYLARMTPIIQAHGGTVNEFIGDAILVLWGAPFERPDDAVRAARCALAMQAAMAELNAENVTLGLPVLSMGIGVHTGVVVAGNIGSKEHVKYGVVGPAVNLASRIQSLAHGGQVLLSQAALARVRGSVRVGPAMKTRVKGVSDAVVVQPLLGMLDALPASPSDVALETELVAS
ncbi:MAG TPA: adenylate/guanylate cyclase domain-containing protein [Methylomirabilota bacterium]|jgi:sigma-B regulation protein RsbU (phosphoserine phosphatase)